MFYITAIIIVSSINIVFFGISLLKNFLIKFKVSDNGFVNVITIIVGAASAICAGSSIIMGINVNNSYEIIRDAGTYDAGYIQMVEEQLPLYIKSCITNFVIAAVFALVYYLLMKKIDKEITNKQKKPKNHWNWNNVK